MKIDDIAAKHKIPLKHLKTLARAGLLKHDKEDPRVEAMRRTLRNGNALSVLQLITLLQEPALTRALGHYEERAKQQVAAIEPGTVKRQAFDEQAKNHIFGAAIMNAESLGALVSVILKTLPAGMTYHALGVRMLWNVPENRRKQTANYLRLAIRNLRNHPDLQTWFEPALDL